MSRWLTIFLLFVLPVQFAWSAAAAYCQHEDAPAKTHIGHHVHEHLGESSSAKAGKLLGDNDCGYCHFSVVKPMVSEAVKLDSTATFSLHAASKKTFSSRGPDLLERPNWRIA
jgi:hypothetical protein